MSTVTIVSTGTANIASVAAALRRCGCTPRTTTNPNEVSDADRVVLPGVGSFAAGMEALNSHGLTPVLRERAEAGRPLLAICLGLQLLCRSSEESPGFSGLGVIDSDVRRLSGELRVPQFGWNTVERGDTSIRTDGYAYYANSYCVAEPPHGWRCATTPYGASIVAAIERGAVLACQFHPELSGAWGAELIAGWLSRTESSVAC
ncbi:MAG: imidazole glycerol phosphate synthase subunit HisH [Planctomycetota bacterium]